jgi:hypothetical protein
MPRLLCHGLCACTHVYIHAYIRVSRSIHTANLRSKRFSALVENSTRAARKKDRFFHSHDALVGHAGQGQEAHEGRRQGRRPPGGLYGDAQRQPRRRRRRRLDVLLKICSITSEEFGMCFEQQHNPGHRFYFAIRGIQVCGMKQFSLLKFHVYKLGSTIVGYACTY